MASAYLDAHLRNIAVHYIRVLNAFNVGHLQNTTGTLLSYSMSTRENQAGISWKGKGRKYHNESSYVLGKRFSLNLAGLPSPWQVQVRRNSIHGFKVMQSPNHNSFPCCGVNIPIKISHAASTGKWYNYI